MSVLAYEVALSFQFAFLFWFYLSFIVIAVAMLGIGVGSVIGYFLRKKYKSSYFPILYYSALGAGGGMIISLIAPGTLGRILSISDYGSNLARLILYVALTMGSATLPFVFSGIFLSVGLSYPTNESRYISFIYFADLIGAGIGAFLLTALLPFSSVEQIIVLCGFATILASTLFIKRVDKAHIGILFFTVLFFGAVFLNIPFFSSMPIEGKFLTSALERGVIVLDTRWTSVSRVDVIEYESGLRRFVENGEYPITISSGVVENRDSDPRWSMFYKNPKSMLAIGSGGGVELAMALHNGVEKIHAVEINPFIVDYMRNEMADFSNRIYYDPKISIAIEDGRTFIHRSKDEYDLIENGVIGSAGLVVPSTSMLTTKDMSVYTVEANQEYIRHLSDNGVAVTIIYGLLDEFNAIDREQGVTSILLKQYNTVKEALKREGLDDEKHFVIFRYLQEAGNFQDSLAQAEYTFIFKKELEKEEVIRLISEAKEYNLEALYAPYQMGRLDMEDIIKNLPENKDVSPAYDNRPFFYFTDRSIGGILLSIIVFILLLTILLIILPIARHQKLEYKGGNAVFLLFFLSIGIGYILIEATLIQKLVLFLGQPSYAFQVVLAGMLISSGLGSMATGGLIKNEDEIRRNLVLVLALIAISIFFYSVLIQRFVMGFIHLGLFLKIILTIVLIAPLAFIMGMPFPLGLRIVNRRNPHNVIWMYGVNASGSVLAGIIGMYVALLHGFSMSLLLGSLLYATGLISISFLGGKNP